MPFSFPAVERFGSTPYEGRDVPFLEWGKQRLEQSMTQTAGRRLFDLGYETLFDNSPELSAEEANRRYGIPEVGFQFDQPVREDTARGRRERKERELLFQSNAAAATHGNFGLKAWGTLPFAIVGQLTDPLELAINAIPFVGVGSRAAGLARLAGETVTPLAERGVLTSMEAIAASGIRYPVLAGRLLEATAGNVIAEIPVAVQNFRDQADYTFEDSLSNIAIGGLFTAGTHAVGRALSATRDVVMKASESTRAKAFNKGLGDIARDQDIDVGREFAMDKSVHLEQMRFDETATLREALQSPEIRDAIKFEAMAAASDVYARIQAGDIEGAFAAARALPLVRDVLGAKLDLGNTLETLKKAIETLPDLGRIETDGRTLNQWVESVEAGRAVEPTGFQKRSPAKLDEIAQMKRIPEPLRKAAREAAEIRRLNEQFAPGSPAALSYAQKLQDYMESKRLAFDSEARAAKRAEDAKIELSQSKIPVSEEDLAAIKPQEFKPASSATASAVEEPTVTVKVREMRDGKAVSGSIEVTQQVAIKGLEERLKILKQLSDCLSA